MQKGLRLNDGHVASLGLLARQDGTRRGYLSKRSADNTKWQTKWFALLQNLLFYFESDSSSRPSGLYLLEGCVCDRAPSPKPTLSAKEPLEKQVRPARRLPSPPRPRPCGTPTLLPPPPTLGALGAPGSRGSLARGGGDPCGGRREQGLRWGALWEPSGRRGHRGQRRQRGRAQRREGRRESGGPRLPAQMRLPAPIPQPQGPPRASAQR